jgi:Holliday junction resolvase RusA-like endonuclease
MTVKITMPLYIEKKNGKKIHLNLNNYRNWHYQTSNNIKNQYQEIAHRKIPKQKHQAIQIEFTLFRGDNRDCDLSNVCSIHDKFFCDALTKHGFIPDDSCKFIRRISYVYGGVEKNNGRVEIEIKVLK